MAQVSLAFCPVSKITGVAALPVGKDVQSELITTTPGVANQSTLQATTNLNVVRIAVTGGNVWVSVGGLGASEGTNFLMIDGTTEYFSTSPGDNVWVFESAI